MSWIAAATIGGELFGGMAAADVVGAGAIGAMGADVAAGDIAGGFAGDMTMGGGFGGFGGFGSGGMSLSQLGQFAGPAGNLLGAGLGAGASMGAANTQANAANQATQAQLAMFGQTQQNLQPWMGAGNVSLANLKGGLGLPSDTSGSMNWGAPLVAPFSPGQYQQSPGFQFQQQQGNQAINANAAARGTYYAPATLQDLSKFQTGLLGNDYQQALQNYTGQQNSIFNKLSGLSSSGQNAAANLGTMGTNVGGQVGGNIIGAGNAQAAGQVGTANAISGGLSGAYNSYLMNQILGQSQQPSYGY